jgi:hypothetical protein
MRSKGSQGAESIGVVLVIIYRHTHGLQAAAAAAAEVSMQMQCIAMYHRVPRAAALVLLSTIDTPIACKQQQQQLKSATHSKV